MKASGAAERGATREDSAGTGATAQSPAVRMLQAPGSDADTRAGHLQ